MKIGKVKKLAANLPDENQYVTHIRNLKEALNHGLVSKKVHRVIKLIKKLGENHILIWILSKKKKIKKWLWERYFQTDE